MKLIFSIILLFILCGKLAAQDFQSTDNANRGQFRVNGYFKDTPSASHNNLTNSTEWNNIFQNRLNFSYRNNNFRAAVEMRNRLISGQMVNDYSALLEEMLKTDDGFFDASFVPFANSNIIWHSMFDRFYVDWQKNNWQVRAGRQRINWGINMVSNPNDLFNTYSFFDVDYEERPGADALRIQHYSGYVSRFELAFAPQRELEKSVAALMYASNYRGYDMQFIAGYYRNKTALGGGWAGNIGTSGFKGEVTLFNNIDKLDSMVVVSAISFDHLFGNGMYGLVEVMYNGGHKGLGGNLLMLTEPMSADNIFISKYAVTANAMYPVTQLFSASMAGMYMPDINAFYISPNITYSLFANFDVSLLAQYFNFKGDISVEQISVYAQLKWSF